MKIYRHGDVLLKSKEVPKEAKQIAKGKERTIALGEVTGHHHTLYGKSSDAVIAFQFNETDYLQINEDLELRHQEHDMLKIEKGSYEIINEQEYDYFNDEIQKVQD